jgi:hypothetical protein
MTGNHTPLQHTHTQTHTTPVTVYNINVDQYHTYHVNDLGVLVHNMCTPENIPNNTTPPPPTTPKTKPVASKQTTAETIPVITKSPTNPKGKTKPIEKPSVNSDPIEQLKQPTMGTISGSKWATRTSELAGKAPIAVPKTATVKIQAKNGYDQITFKWVEGSNSFEVRWHTKTPSSPAGEGNTWVVTRITKGTPTGQSRQEHILVGERWISRNEWQKAIYAFRNKTATAKQLELLQAGHFAAP